MTRGAVAGLVVTVVLLAACSKSDPAEPEAGSAAATSSATQPGLAVQVDTAPQQENSTRPDVTFDPCTQIGDPAIAELGYDPSTRERDDRVEWDLASLGCTFDMVNGSGRTVEILGVESTNVRIDELRTKYSDVLEEVRVGGRDGIRYQPKSSATPEICYLDLESGVGTVNVSVFVSFDLEDVDPCDRVVEVAEKLLTLVPEL